ncbi:MAG: hypothetical protein IPL99_23935 [Candidatus Competibacteraceae bacterium]|nr:hypothetical protein [Candidatus Competibacteraceae bacterium]
MNRPRSRLRWKTADLLFQLTDQELSRESSLFTDTSVAAGLLKSYIFIAIELKAVTTPRQILRYPRQINRLFPMPVRGVLQAPGHLTLAVINRRPNKLDESKDVLGKVTLIIGIDLAQPTAATSIFFVCACPKLVHPQRSPSPTSIPSTPRGSRSSTSSC